MGLYATGRDDHLLGERFNRDVVEVLKISDASERLATQGGNGRVGNSLEQFAQVIKSAGIRPQ